jgi:superoxide dismutase
MSIRLPALRYTHSALPPITSGMAPRRHHGKHQHGNVEKLSALA